MLRLLKEKSAGEIWRASGRQLAGWGLTDRAVTALALGRRTFDSEGATSALRRDGVRFVPYGTDGYPKELCHLECPPVGLFVRGSAEVLTSLALWPRVTIVGTRKATPEGLQTAEIFTRGFSSRGVVVVSGMAIGIDAQAHKTALDSGGRTVAVLGCGVDVVYPPRNLGLYERIVKRGIVVSEFPPGSRPNRWTFPQRNRLLAALGDAVLVIEGSITSGALQTARWALELGRPIFSVPGSIFREGCQGCNSLLHDGAMPALQPGDAVEDFLAQTRIERGTREAAAACRSAVGEQRAFPTQAVENSQGLRILRALEAGPAGVDRLVALTGLSVREVGAALGELEACSLVARGDPGSYVRVP